MNLFTPCIINDRRRTVGSSVSKSGVRRLRYVIDWLPKAVSRLAFSILTCQPIRVDRSLLASPCLPSQSKTGGSHMSRHTRALKHSSYSRTALACYQPILPAFPCDPTTPHSPFNDDARYTKVMLGATCVLPSHPHNSRLFLPGQVLIF